VSCASATRMPSVQGSDDDDASFDCSDSSTASSFEDEGEEGGCEIDAEFEVVDGSVMLYDIIAIVIVIDLVLQGTLHRLS